MGDRRSDGRQSRLPRNHLKKTAARPIGVHLDPGREPVFVQLHRLRDRRDASPQIAERLRDRRDASPQIAERLRDRREPVFVQLHRLRDRRDASPLIAERLRDRREPVFVQLHRLRDRRDASPLIAEREQDCIGKRLLGRIRALDYRSSRLHPLRRSGNLMIHDRVEVGYDALFHRARTKVHVHASRVMSWAELFLTHVPDERRARFSELTNLESSLAQLLVVARGAWSELQVPEDAFIAFLGRCLSEDAAKNLAGLRADDLYLACAYGRGVPGAYEAFEQYCMRHVHVALQRKAIPAPLIADIGQDLRRRVVEMQNPRPGQKCYSGRGELVGWLCVTALRDARHKLDNKQREQPLTNFADVLLAPDEDAETAFLRKTYKPELTRAFQEAVASLTSEERNLLRYHFIKNMTIDEVGRIYGIHRATAARKINRARGILCERTEANFRARIPIDTSAYKDLLPLIESQIRIQLATMRQELEHAMVS